MKENIPIPTADAGSAVGIFFTTYFIYQPINFQIMETLFIASFWVFALIGVICTLMFVVSLFRGRGDNGNNGGNNKTATNKVNATPSNNGGPATTNNTTPPPHPGGTKN